MSGPERTAVVLATAAGDRRIVTGLTLGERGRRVAGAGLAGLGCENKTKPIIIKGPVVQPVSDARWNTMRAVHHVHIDFPRGDGRDSLDVRGLKLTDPNNEKLFSLERTRAQLDTLVAEWPNVAAQAASQEASFADFLERLLAVELNARRERSRSVMLKMATLPSVKTLEQYDFKDRKSTRLNSSHQI